MTYDEILAKYEMVRIGQPKKGELFLTRKNHDLKLNTFEVHQAKYNWKKLSCQIVVERV